MHKYHIYYLSNIRQVLLFFSTRHYENDDRALPDTHWICLNVLLNYEVLIYFLLLLEKVKTAQKISQFSCFHYTSACFYPFVKPNPQILYHFQKHCYVKAIQYKNRTELLLGLSDMNFKKFGNLTSVMETWFKI